MQQIAPVTVFSRKLAVPGVIVLCFLAFPHALSATEANEAHQHIGHVMDAWQATPDRTGLLSAAEQEAQIALRHAGFAIAGPEDIAAIKLHTRHVLHAIDPRVEGSGPGKGFGVLRASAATIAHIKLAAKSADASRNVLTHAKHVEASADNVVSWCRRIINLGRRVGETPDAVTAYAIATEIRALLGNIVNGRDANGDGTISWGEDEGGLKQLREHMSYMKSGEGLM
ncbi:MAG: hypothetical protein ACE5EM_02145 [Sphingomonadales bacterium]